MKRLLSSIFCLFLSSSLIADESFTPAEFLENRNSSIPQKTANMSRLEGWTLLSYFVGTDGRIKDVEVIDSSDEDKFAGKAIHHLDGYLYSPAKFEGNAVDSADVTLFRTDKSFQGSANDGISRGFKRYYNDADNFILAGEMSKAKASLDELIEDHTKNLTEQALAAWIQSLYYFKSQNWPAYGSAVQVAYYLNDYLPKQMKLKNIQNRLQWHMFKREFSDAIYVLEELKRKSEGALSDNDYQGMVDEVKKHLKTNENNQIDITLANGRAWHHRVPRSKISLTLLEGNIEFAELRCDNGRQAFSVFPIEDTVIPEAQLKCTMYVKGTDGTRFSFVESGTTRVF